MAEALADDALLTGADDAADASKLLLTAGR
jgi:hypothetical protein